MDVSWLFLHLHVSVTSNSQKTSLWMSHKCVIPPDRWSNMFVNAIISMLVGIPLCQHINSHVIRYFFEYLLLPFIICSPQISSWLKAVRSTGSVSACSAPSRCAAGLHPVHCHSSRTQFGDLCSLQAQPLFADWQNSPPSHPHLQLQRHPSVPQLADRSDQVCWTELKICVL